MDALCYAGDARELIEKFLSLQPLVNRTFYRSKIDAAVRFELLKRSMTTATREVVTDALNAAFPTAEPLTLPLTDPDRLARMVSVQSKIDRDSPAVKITRWDAPKAEYPREVENVFALLAGPRIGGNTDCILDALLDGAQPAGCSIEKSCFSELQINPCTGCFACEGKKLERYCSIHDDMFLVYERLLACDAFVLAFPIYTSRESAQAAIFFDRLKAIFSGPWRGHQHKPKRGALVVTWAWPSEYFYREVIHHSAFVLRYFGVEVEEVITGCGFMSAYYAKGTAKLDAQGIDAARAAGRQLVQGR